MVTQKTGRAIGRPKDPQKRSAILNAGWTLFLKHGVEGASLESVAAKAGVSKATLYKYFPDKPSLFEAGVIREMELIENAQRQAGIPENTELADTLKQFGIGIMMFICSDPAVDFYNALSGELRRHEGLARRFYSMGPGRTRANLASILAGASKKGQLQIDDAEEAAEHLFGLWQGFSNFQLSLGVESKKLRKSIPERVDRAVTVFLRAYAHRS